MNYFAEGNKKNQQLRSGSHAWLPGKGWLVSGWNKNEGSLEFPYPALIQLVIHEKFLALFMPWVITVVHSGTCLSPGHLGDL